MKSLQNLEEYQVLLASASPRRKELLGLLGFEFEIAKTLDVDESYPESLPAIEVAPYLSKLKAESYRVLIDSNQLIITADTIVINNGQVLGKPATKEEAINILSLLSGHTHEVITGVTVTSVEKQITFSVCTQVEFA